MVSNNRWSETRMPTLRTMFSIQINALEDVLCMGTAISNTNLHFADDAGIVRSEEDLSCMIRR